MWTRMTLKDGKATDYGLGWSISSVKGHTNVNHNGAINGCLANMSRFIDDRLTVIVLVNQSGLTDTGKIARGIARLYIPAIRPKEPPLPSIPPKISPEAVAALTGRYEYFNNYMLTITDQKGKLAGHLPGGVPEDYLVLSATSFWDAEDGVQFTVIKNARGEVTGLRLQNDEGWDHTAPRIGPLFHSLTPTPDPDPTLTRKIERVLKAMAQGRKAVEESQDIAPGRKKNFPSLDTKFIGLRSLSFIAAEDVSARNIERHDAKVSRILYYRLVIDKVKSYVLVFLTADGLVTDTDVVDD
jgi:hypothetical protein